MSTIVGSGATQEAAMDPSLTVGMRQFFTELDYAVLQDIGWPLSAISEPATWIFAGAFGVICVIWRRRSRS